MVRLELENVGLNFVRFWQSVIRKAILMRTPAERVRSSWFRLRGATLGKGTFIPPRTICTWPHQVSIGRNCVLQSDIFFNYDHFWTPGPSICIGNRVFVGRGCEFNIRKKITIADDCLIASGVKMIDHDHGFAAGKLIRAQDGPESAIHIGSDVWIGTNAVILKGVDIGDGAIVGAGAVVTHSIPAGEIWLGIPAKRREVRNSPLEFL